MEPMTRHLKSPVTPPNPWRWRVGRCGGVHLWGDHRLFSGTHPGDVRSGAWRSPWGLVLAAGADRLTAKGHRVFAPTLTGFCERSHLLNDKIDLTTQINDIVNEIKWKDLDQIVLVRFNV
jgi:hypothetical protein